ncbi:MAG: ornithine carbamoyltransferase [Solirubrobacterales bacterium]
MAPDFLTGEEISESLGSILERAAALKEGRPRTGADSLAGKSVALIFEHPSTRTRVSFEVGIAELGGTPVVLRSDELQIKRGESIGDVGRVLSRYVHAIAMRTGSDEKLADLAAAADVPVINMLTPLHHPCQALADLMTLQEQFGELEGLRVAFVGDGNNVARSLAILGRAAGVEVVVSSPPGLELDGEEGAILITDPAEAVAGVDAVYADVWIGMTEPDAEAKRAALVPYRVDEELLAKASDRAVVMHCLPAHPGEEISEGALYGERSVVFDQAENRLHAQKALLEELVD